MNSYCASYGFILLSAEYDVSSVSQSADVMRFLRQVTILLYLFKIKSQSNSQQLEFTTPSAVPSKGVVLLWQGRKHHVIGMQRSKSPDRMWNRAWKSTEWTRRCSVRPADGRWGQMPRHLSLFWSELSVDIHLVRNTPSTHAVSVTNRSTSSVSNL